MKSAETHPGSFHYFLEEKVMKPVLALSYLLFGAALFPMGSFAASEADQSQGNLQATAKQELPIASKIRAEMAAEHVPSMTGISVDADPSGVVSLTGSALSQDDIDKVVSIAHNTAGVTAVNNNVTVSAN
jgi:BON domain-containing protein